MKTLTRKTEKEAPAFEVDYKDTAARGESFFVAVLAAMDRLAPGQVLRTRADFEPALLYSFMDERGFDRYTICGEDGVWQVDFCRRRKVS